jgi:CHAT domain-containing protein/predicted negative regulator of RcsB-dependent stress response
VSTKAVQQTECDAMIQRLLALDGDTIRRELISQHASLDWDQLVSTLTDRVRQEVHVSAANAHHLADIAILVAETTGSRIALAKSLRAKANALYTLDQHSNAIEMHERAAELFEAAGEHLELARTLSGSIQPLLLLGRYDQALAAGERARAIFTGQGNKWRLARLEINIGNIYHRQDRFTEALACYERAYEELLSHDDAEGLAAVLSNLSLCHISLNEFAKSLELHQKARQHCEQKGMPVLVAYADYNIAYLYFLRGEYGRAIQMLREAAASARKANDAYQMALCNLDLAEIYLELNLGAEAAELAPAAHEAFQQLGFGYEAAKALAFAAIAASQQGQAFEGLKLFTKSREMFVAENNQVWPSLIDLYQGLVLFNEGRLFEARRLCTTAREFFSASTMPSKAVLAELLLARIALRLNDSLAARQHCDSALQQLKALQRPVLACQAEFLSGRIEQSAGKDDHAYESYCRARSILEMLRGNVQGEELKISFFHDKLEVYENLIELCLRRPCGVEEAFTHIEQAKSRSLMDLLLQPVHVPSEADAGQSDLVRSIRNLREELNWYYNLIEREQLRPEERSQERIQNLERHAREREHDLMRAVQEASAAEMSDAGLLAPSNVSLHEIRETLSTDTSLVEFFCVKERVLACVLDRDDLRIFPVTLQSRVQKLMQLLQFQLSKFRLDPQYVSTFQESLLQSTQAHLKSLYQELIAPVRDLLKAKHLVFVPHGLLHYVPFHALHDGESYLVDRFSISYAPSASIYALCQQKPANISGQSLILGIPDAQAPSIADEVEALQSILPDAKLFKGPAATEDILRTHGPNSRILHIATHGYFRQDNPMFSSIRLGGSYLSLYDLYHLKLPANLVTLSGCATGLNVIRPGDEVVGLVRGLLQAGAQSLVLSLWDVHDRSTKEFMISFYTRLQQGFPKALALQGAMVELRERYPHPYYWAPFTLIGKA